jgi:hypothetical protein
VIAYTSHFPNKVVTTEEIVQQILYWLPLVDREQTWIKVIKFHLSYLFAIAENQTELPDPGSLLEDGRLAHQRPGYPLCGKLGKDFHRDCFGPKKHRIAFRNTVLHGIKKGLPQMDPDLISKNLDAYKARLTQVKVTPDFILDEIRANAQRVFGTVTWRDFSGDSSISSISMNSCYDNGRSAGGALGDLLNRYKPVQLNTRQLLTASYHPRVGVQWIDMPFDSSEILAEAKLDALEELDEVSKCKVHAVLEPLKVRLITAGDTHSNALWTNLQKLLWRKLQKFKQFRLTGEEISDEIVNTLASEELPGLLGMDKWCSGDYEAATDNLHMDASLAALEAISGDMTTFAILKKSMCGTKISFEPFRKLGYQCPDDFVQTNGQLMGCVFSFVILCLINLSMYKLSLEAYSGSKWKVEDLPVLVNGDDILFRTNDEHYSVWSDLINQVGFKKSVGKNYTSADFCVINSRYFASTRKGMKMVPYLNLSYLTNIRKGGLRTDHTDKSDIKTVFVTSYERQRMNMKDLDTTFGYEPLKEGKWSRVVEKYKEYIYYENKDMFDGWMLPLDYTENGLRLRPLDLEWDLSTERFTFYHWFSANKGKYDDRSNGDSSCPATMTPWKFYTLGSKKLEMSDYLIKFRNRVESRIGSKKKLSMHSEPALKIMRQTFKKSLDVAERKVELEMIDRSKSFGRTIRDPCVALENGWDVYYDKMCINGASDNKLVTSSIEEYIYRLFI